MRVPEEFRDSEFLPPTQSSSPSTLAPRTVFKDLHPLSPTLHSCPRSQPGQSVGCPIS